MKAVLFDFDGVIVDSEQYWPIIENKYLKDIAPLWESKHHPRIVGISFYDMYEVLCKEFGATLSVEKFEEYGDMMATAVYEQCNLIDGIGTLVQNIAQSNIPYAIASSSRRGWIDTALARFDLPPFETIITSEDIPVGRGKPQPDIYLKAAEALEVEPENCIVIEDSRNGILSGKAAGMHCIAFRNGINDEQDLSEADKIVNNIAEIEI